MTTRILVPPGIGDIYWTLVKLKAIQERYGFTNPELTIVTYPDEHGIYLRSIPYLEMFDSFTIATPPTVPNAAGLQHIWDEAYSQKGKSIFENVMGYDYFIAYNGRVNSGGWIENDDFACEWRPKMSDDTEHLIKCSADMWRSDGSYAVMFWPFYGSYESHLSQFPMTSIVKVLNKFIRKYDVIPILVGADWFNTVNPLSANFMNQLENGAINAIGRIPDLRNLFGLLHAAKIVLGYHSGITNMAAMFGTKTLLLWDDYFPESTSYACVPPDVRGTTYRAVRTKNLTADVYFEMMCSFYESA